MTSPLSSKPSFLYPKFLKPLGANAISQINPVSLFPDGIPGYIAPKKQNFTNSRFFFNNRPLKITTSSYPQQVQSQKKSQEFFYTPSSIQQEQNSKTHSIPDEDGEIDNSNHQNHQIQTIHQNPAISLKSNIQSNSSFNLSDCNKETITPSQPPSPLPPETITPQSDNLADIHYLNSNSINSPIDNPLLNPKTLTPKSGNLADISLPNNNNIASVDNSPLNPKQINSQSDSLPDVKDLPHPETINPSRQLFPLPAETITPQSDNLDSIRFPNSKRSNPSVDNSLLNPKKINPQLDSLPDVKTVSNPETITSKSNNLEDISLPNGKSLNPSNSHINSNKINPQLDSFHDLNSLPNKENINPSRQLSPLPATTITPKSNNLDSIHFPDSKSITPSVDNSILKPKEITPQSDSLPDVKALPNQENINSSQQPSPLPAETINPQSDNLDSIHFPDSKSITSSVDNSLINSNKINPQSDSFPDIALPNQETTTLSRQSSPLPLESITPQSKNLDSIDFSNSSNINPSVDNSLINLKEINPSRDNSLINPKKIHPQSNSLPDIALLNQETTLSRQSSSLSLESITPQSKNLADIALPNSKRINPSVDNSLINPKKIHPQSDSLSDVTLPTQETINPSTQPSLLQAETINPQLDNLNSIHFPNSKRINPSVDNSLLNPRKINPQSDSLPDIALPNQETIISSRQLSSLIIPESNYLDSIHFSNSSNTNLSIDNSILNPKEITFQVDNLPDVKALPNQETSTPSRQSSFLKPKTITSNSDSFVDANSLHRVQNPSNSTSTSRITFLRKPIAPFSFVNTPQKTTDFFSKNNSEVTEKENSNIRSLAFSPNIINSKSPTNNNISSQTKSSVPDRWSNIAELLDKTASNDTYLNTKSENKNISQNNNEGNIIHVDKKNDGLFLKNPTKVNKNSNNTKTLNQKIDNTLGQDLDIYKVQLTPNKPNYPGYQYQPLNSNKIVSEKLSIEEVNNSNLSLKEEMPTETENLNTNELETNKDESYLLDVLAGEIYILLQQRLEIEKERQGKFYI